MGSAAVAWGTTVTGLHLQEIAASVGGGIPGVALIHQHISLETRQSERIMDFAEECDNQRPGEALHSDMRPQGRGSNVVDADLGYVLVHGREPGIIDGERKLSVHGIRMVKELPAGGLNTGWAEPPRFRQAVDSASDGDLHHAPRRFRFSPRCSCARMVNC